MNILGIDPGQTGGWAVIGATGKLIRSGDAPFIAGKWDICEVDSILDSLDGTTTKAIIEDVGGIPGQSASAAFSFGFGVGLWHMAIVNNGLSLETVRPQEWQKQYVTAKEVKSLTKPQKKKRYIIEAEQRWPGFKFTSGTADAALIAEWYRLKGALLIAEYGRRRG